MEKIRVLVKTGTGHSIGGVEFDVTGNANMNEHGVIFMDDMSIKHLMNEKNVVLIKQTSSEELPAPEVTPARSDKDFNKKKKENKA